MRLTELFKFAGMFFASSAGIVDGGAVDTGDMGGGDAGEVVTDTGGAEDGSVVDDTETGATQEDETGVDGESGGGVQDGRAVPNAIKQAFAKLKEIDSKAADLARRSYYEASDFKRVFPSVTEARDAHDLIESLGGSEGIGTLQKEVQDYAGELTRFSEGNPQAIEDFARDYPQGLAKLTPLAVDKMRQIDGPGYERMASGIIAQTLRDKGVAGSINRVIELIGDGKQKDAHELASKIAQWIDGVDQFARTKPQNEESPEAKALKEERANLNREKQQTFTTRVGTSVMSEINKAIDAGLTPYLKTVKLTPEQRKSLQNGVRTQLTRGFETNSAYQQRMKALIAQGDENAILRYVRGQLASDRVLKSIKAEWSTRGFSTSKARTATANSGTMQVAQKPSADQIDWAKDRSRQRFMRGEATLKNGKTVRWDINAV